MNDYQEALKRARKEGVGRCDDAAVMASFCENTVQLLLGAVGPQLIWEGAQKQGWTALELVEACNTNPTAVEELQWL